MMVTTQNPITGLSGITKKTSLDIPSSSSTLQIRSLSPCSSNSKTTVLVEAQHKSDNSYSKQKHEDSIKTYYSRGAAINSRNRCVSDISSISDNSDDEFGDNKSQRNRRGNYFTRNFTDLTEDIPNSSSVSTCSKTKSAFFKSRKKENYRIRFELEDASKNKSKFDTGPYAKSSGDSGLTSSSFSSSSQLGHSATKSTKNETESTQTQQRCLGRREIAPKLKYSSSHLTRQYSISNSTLNLSASCSNITSNYNLGGQGVSLSVPDNSPDLTSNNKKPKRTSSLKKLLTKSRSFVFSSRNSSSSKELVTNYNSISRAELVSKYHQKCHQSKINANTINKPKCNLASESRSLPSIEHCVKEPDNNSRTWVWGYSKHESALNSSNHERNDTLGLSLRSRENVCRNCGTSSEDFIPHRFHNNNNNYSSNYLCQTQNKSRLGMGTDDIQFYGRYSKLSSEEDFEVSKPQPIYHHQDQYQVYSATTKSNRMNDDRNFLSLKYDQRIFEQSQPTENKEQGHKSLCSSYKGYSHYNSSRKNRKDKEVQQVIPHPNNNNNDMAHQSQFHPDRVGFASVADQDQRFSYFDCKIPRPKLKFVIPTHSYGVTPVNKSKNLQGGELVRSVKHFGRKAMLDVSDFTEVSLDDENDNDDAAYASGSGSGSSSRIRSPHSSDETLSEFEREQEQFTLHVNSRRLLSLKKSAQPKHMPHTKQQTVDILKSLNLFRKLNTGFLTKVTDHIIEVSYECGEYIQRQGSGGEGLFIVISGTAKVTFTSNVNGEEIYLKMLHPGDCFGEKALQDDQVNMMNVIANDDQVSCLIIAEEGFNQIMTKSLEFRTRFGPSTIKIHEDFERIQLEDLRLISTLGIGGFGRVELVTLNSNPSAGLALKCMKKSQIVTTRQIAHIKNEKAIMLESNCDFICKLFKTFKDAKHVYMLLELCQGGELWGILRDRGHFNDSTTRFYVGCVLEALKYLHSRNIIYRDLKPENLLLDAKGYLKLVDFGFAKKLEGNKTWTFCGTPEYVAPEIILNKGHDVTADYWSLGVLMYELLTGTPPFVGGDPMKTYKIILKGIDFIDFPPTVGKNAYTLIRRLCKENPEERLGFQRGLSEIKKHKWFDGLEWNALRSKLLVAPIIPFSTNILDNFDKYPPSRGPPADDDLSGWDWDF